MRKNRLYALALLNVIIFFFLLFPLLRRHAAFIRRYKEEKQKLTVEKRKLDELKKEKDFLLREKRKLENFLNSKMLKGDMGLVELRSFIINAHSRSGISFGGVSFSDPEKVVKSLFKVKTSFEVEAPYFSLRRFIYYLESSEKLIVLRSLSMRRTSPNRAKMRVIMEAYFYED